MASNKLQRINEDIRYHLSELLRRVKDPRVQQGLISVTAVDTAGDLKTCKVYLSVLGLTDQKEFLRGLRSCSGYLRHELGASMKLRSTPELNFILDKSIEYGAHINQMLRELNVPQDGDETAEEQSDDE